MKVVTLVFLFSVSVSFSQEKSCCAVICPNGAGSGTVIHSKDGICLVLTNRHVILNDANKPEDELWIIHNRKRYDAKYVAHSDNDDLGLVSCVFDAEPVKLADKDAEVGTKIRHWGRATEYQEGKVVSYTQFAREQDGGKVGDADYLSVNGDSGAGLFNEKGLLIGINYGKKGKPNQPRKEWLSAFVRVERINVFVLPYLK